jgi:thioester reductase-like protein
VLVTGALGFLGSVVLEKLLRETEVRRSLRGWSSSVRGDLLVT